MLVHVPTAVDLKGPVNGNPEQVAPHPDGCISAKNTYLLKLVPSLPVLDTTIAVTGDQPVLIVRVTHAGDCGFVSLQSTLTL